MTIGYKLLCAKVHWIIFFFYYKYNIYIYNSIVCENDAFDKEKLTIRKSMINVCRENFVIFAFSKNKLKCNSIYK